MDLRLEQALPAAAPWPLSGWWPSPPSLSAYFSLAANSWTQHPVGYRINPVTHRPQLTSIVALMTSSTVLAAWPHVLFASFLVAWLAQIAWVPSTPTCSRPPSRRTSRSARTPGAGAAAVERAAALAGAAPFIEALPRGYDTPLVSAGCACRPGSGRRSPRPAPSSATPRCCWNQPAAHLDPLRPAASRAALEGLMAGRTVVPVTHRPGQAPATSRLLRLDHGRLAQDSRHLPALTARPTLAMTP